LFELYIQSYDFAAVYTLYIALFLTIGLQVLWLINVESPLLESSLRNDIYLLSESASAYKYQAELSIDLHILVLRKIRMKVAPEDDMSIFLPL
jgi:hypothetical protein